MSAMMESRKLGLLCSVVFVACLAAYLPTLNPAFRADDSPETIAACVTLGIQHPPGYPLHTLSGRLFSLLPLGAPAWRLNLMAAFFAAACTALVALLTALWSGAVGARALAAGALAGIGLGYSRTFWSQALAAKGGLYTSHAFWMTLLLLALTAWKREQAAQPQRDPWSSRYLALAALVLGVGFGNHWETQALALPLALVWAWNLGKPGSRWPGALRSAQLLGLLALGLSLYLYLPLRARLDPALNWGDPRDSKQFFWVLLRQEYLDLEIGFLKSLRQALLGQGNWSAVVDGWAYVERQALRVLRFLLSPTGSDLGLGMLALSLLGLRALAVDRDKRILLLASLAWVLAFVLVITFYFHLKPEMIWILDVFLIPVYLMQAIWAGLGLAWLLGKLRGRWAAVTALVAALGLLPWGLYHARAQRVDQSEHWVAWDYGQDLLLSLPHRSIMLAEGDFNTMPIYYLQQVAGKRRDVDHLTTVFLSTDWGVWQLRRTRPWLGVEVSPPPLANQRVGDGAVLKAVLTQAVGRGMAAGRPVQASLFRQVQADTLPEWEPAFSPAGLTVRLNAPALPAEALRREGLFKAMRTRHLALDRSTLDPSPEFAISNYGTAALELANRLRAQKQYAKAMQHYALAVAWTSRANLAEAEVHWGLALAQDGPRGGGPDLEGAAGHFLRALQVKPLYEAAVNLAGVRNQQKRYAEAEAAARQAVALRPGLGQPYNNLGIAQYYQGRQADAIATLRHAARLAPQDQQIQNNLRALGAQ